MNGVFQILPKPYVDSWKSSTFAIDFGNIFEMNLCSWLAKLSIHNSNSSGVGEWGIGTIQRSCLVLLSMIVVRVLQIDGNFVLHFDIDKKFQIICINHFILHGQ
jgi:hypothetical protein